MQQRSSAAPKSLHQRLVEEACALRGQAEVAPRDERDRLIERARQLDSEASMEGWLSSEELKPPT